MKNIIFLFLLLTGITNVGAQNGEANKLDFKRQISVYEARAVKESLSTELGQCKTGVYNMRGGKEGGAPASHAYQYQYNLDTDNYAGYFVVTHKDFPYDNAILTSTYNLSEKLNGAGHSGYNLTKRAFKSFLNNPQSKNFPELKAIYLLYFNLAAQENADLSGPFTYTEDKCGSEDPKTYESLKDIYYGIKANLDSIVDCFKYCEENRSEEYKEYLQMALYENEADGFSNYFYGGKGLGNYIRLANSLKFRMAMHMVKVEPKTAQKWAEEAVAGGVIEEVGHQQGVFPSVIGFVHPLVEIANNWNDTRINASFESLLMSLDHPYTKYFFLKNSNDITNLGEVKATASLKGEVTPANSRIMGIRAGSHVGDGQQFATNAFIGYSSINSDVIASSPLYFISLAEVEFLRAEGALRGWNMGGSAQQFYESGIRHAYIEDPFYLANGWCTGATYNDFVEDYMNLAEAKPYIQVEPQGLGEPWPSVTKIGVKWNETDSQEVKLEKIITQKYIALFPNSHEAWTELRRTGYPKLFPVLNAEEGDGSLKQGDIIRRIPWASTDPIQRLYIQETGIPALGGQDLQATRLWWDTSDKIVAEYNGIYYSIRNNTATVEASPEGIGYKGDIVIPEKVRLDDKDYIVTDIGYVAFWGCSGLTSVTIPNSVKSIGYGAFKECSGLNSVTIGNSVTSIGRSTFEGCSGLTSVTIPNSVTSIGDYAFKGCSGLTSVTIGNSVTSIGNGAFGGCTSVEYLNVDINSVCLKDIFGTNLKEVVIGNSVTSIGDYAFSNCKKLASVIIGNSVTNIGKSSFSGCEELAYASFGRSVTSIGEDAFRNCKNLMSITIPSSLTNIGSGAFNGADNISEIYSLAILPPSCASENVFSANIYETAMVYVPNTNNALTRYLGAEVWKLFYNIEERNNYDAETHIVSTSTDGYATFYSSESAYTLPNGISASVVTACADHKLTYRTIASGSEGGVIPKGTAVVLVNGRKTASNFTLMPSESNASYTGTNYLHGSDEATTTTAGGSNYYYKLTYGEGAESDTFGWYWGARDGSAFQIEGHRAWLAVPKTSAARSVFFMDDLTAIEDVPVREDNDILYNLQGRRVSSMNRAGIYIMNGKKVINSK